MTGDDIIKQMKAAGWLVLRQQGSHVRLGKGDVKPGTLASIERQIGFKIK